MMSPSQSSAQSHGPVADAGPQGPKGSVKPADQFHKVVAPDPIEDTRQKEDSLRAARESAKREAEAKAEDAKHDANVALADKYWSQKAEEKDWDCVKADLSVYRYSGTEIKEDPRRTEEYRRKVVALCS